MYSSIKSIKTVLCFVISLLGCMPAWAACTFSSASPQNITIDKPGSNDAVTTLVTLTMSCLAKDPYSVSSDAQYFYGQVGSGPTRLRASIDKDASQTAVFGSPITGAKNNSAGTTTVTLYVRLAGEDGGVLGGYGTYSVQVTGKVTSGATVTPFTINISGTITAQCAVYGGDLDFGTVQSGTSPMQIFQGSATCSAGIPFTLSQQGGAPIYVNGSTIGYAWAYKDGGASSTSYADTPESFPASMATSAHFLDFYIKLEGMTRGSPLVGSGAFTTTIPIILTY